MENNLILSKNLRKKLKKPLGKLITNVDNANVLKIHNNKKIIICVGDKTSEQVLQWGIKPKICVYDGKVMRKEIGILEIIKKFDAKTIHVKNPRGKLTQEVFRAIKKGLIAKENVKIYVDGEEDLVTLAAIHLSPLNSFVLYGQPGEGLVAVNVDDTIKRKVKNILKEMGKERENTRGKKNEDRTFI
jgi:hypothetical protein